jgi:hypothetical protein
MEGFIIALATDENSDLTQFWDGSLMVDDIAMSHLYPTRTNARYEMGQITSLYSDNELSVHPVTRTVTFARNSTATAPTRVVA